MSLDYELYRRKYEYEYRASSLNQYHKGYHSSVNRYFSVFIGFISILFFVIEQGTDAALSVIFMICVGITIAFIIFVLYCLLKDIWYYFSDWVNGR